MNPLDVGRDIVSLYSAEAGRKGLVLELQSGGDIAQRLLGDPSRLRQILLNLVSNAIKFTDKGKVTLHIDCLSGDEASQRLRFSVVDTGIGIAPDKRQYVFDAFSQADDSYSRRHGGSGLGLAISSRLAELMGGRIELDSAPGEGSRFRFEITLPVVEGRSRDSSTVPSASGEDAVAALGLRVLLVEDNPVNRLVAEEMLLALGCSHITASNGREGVEAYRQGKFDLILMDCEMPIMSGYQAAETIRGIEASGNLPAVPIVALTAHALPENRQKTQQAGMDDFLSKPFTLAQLKECLGRYRVV